MRIRVGTRVTSLLDGRDGIVSEIETEGEVAGMIGTRTVATVKWDDGMMTREPTGFLERKETR